MRHKSSLARVFIHGWMGHPSDWSLFVKAQDICITLPGHNHSKTLKQKNWFTVCIENIFKMTQHIDAFHLVGYSLGGRIGLSFAEKYPNRIAKLSLISTHIGCKSAVQQQEKKNQELNLIDQFNTLSFDAFLKYWYSQQLFYPLSPFDQKKLVQKRIQEKPESILSAFKGFSHQYYSFKQAVLKKHAAKTQIIVGSEDKKYVKQAKELNMLLPQMKLTILNNAGHACLISHPKEILNLL